MKFSLKGVFFAGLVLIHCHLSAQTLRTATATASTFNGFVVGVTMNDGGAGYIYPPSVAFSGVGSGAGAYSVVSDGAVTQIIVTNAGSGYTTIPSVLISAPSSLLYSFRSGNAYVTVPDSASLDSTTDQLTVECWFSRVSDPGDWNAMVSKEDNTYNLTGYFLGSAGNSVRPVVYSNPNIYEGLFNNSNPTFPAWHHLAMQYDRTNYSAWLDGNLIYSTNSPAQIILGSNPLSIGCQNSGYRAFDGYIDEVRISNTIRYTNAFNPQIRFVSDSNTIALYHFDEGSGSVVHDSSANGNDGIIQGSSAWSTNVPSISAAVVNLHKAVYVDFSNLLIGTNYQLQISTNLYGGAWLNYGTPFTATNPTMTYSNYWNVGDWGQLYFRLSQ
jgi:hypothetical protein